MDGKGILYSAYGEGLPGKKYTILMVKGWAKSQVTIFMVKGWARSQVILMVKDWARSQVRSIQY